MHDSSERARHQEELAAKARGEGYAKGAADGVLSAGLIDPSASQLQDYVVHRRREQAEKVLPPAPATDGRDFISAAIEGCVKSGALRDGSKGPKTLAQLDAELKARKLAEEEGKIKAVVDLYFRR